MKTVHALFLLMHMPIAHLLVIVVRVVSDVYVHHLLVPHRLWNTHLYDDNGMTSFPVSIIGRN